MDETTRRVTARANEGARFYWRRVRQLSLALLLVWFVLTFVTIWFARELSGFSLLGWPVSFYLAAQGALLGYVAIVGLYAWAMQKLDAAAHGRDSHAE